MATKIRLKRMGARSKPHYRLVVMDSKKPRDSHTLEELGHYCPTTDPPTINIDVNRALHWLHVGAQPTDTVRSLLAKQGVMAAFRSGVKPGEMEQQAPIVAEAEAEAEAVSQAEEEFEEPPLPPQTADE